MRIFKLIIPLLIISLLLSSCRADTSSDTDGDELSNDVKNQSLEVCSYSWGSPAKSKSNMFVIGYRSEQTVFNSADDISITVFIGINKDYEEIIANGYHLKETDIYIKNAGVMKEHKVISINDDITSEKYELNLTDEERFPKEFIGHTVNIPKELFRSTAGIIEIFANGKNYGTSNADNILFGINLQYEKDANERIHLKKYDYSVPDLTLNDFDLLIAREEFGISSLNHKRFEHSISNAKLVSNKNVFDINNVTLQLYHGFTDYGIERYEEHKGTDLEGIDPIFINARLTCATNRLDAKKTAYANPSTSDSSPSPLEYHITDIADVYSSEEFYYYDSLKEDPLTFVIPAERFEYDIGQIILSIYAHEFYIGEENLRPSKEVLGGATFYYMKKGDKVYITASYWDLKP